MINLNNAAGMQESFDAMVAATTEMTERNDATGSYVVSMQWLVDNFGIGHGLLKKFKCIQEIQSVEGFLPHQIADYRHENYEFMKQVFKNELQPADYNKWYNSL